MQKFKSKSKKESAEISTASLPDIIFMLLFFFMVTTVMRPEALKVKNELPQAKQITRLEDKSMIDYIYVGPPNEAELGTEARIQLNGQFAEVQDVQTFVELARQARESSGNGALNAGITTVLKVHNETKMGIISDIKQELREVNALKINYSTQQSAEEN